MVVPGSPLLVGPLALERQPGSTTEEDVNRFVALDNRYLLCSYRPARFRSLGDHRYGIVERRLTRELPRANRCSG